MLHFFLHIYDYDSAMAAALTMAIYGDVIAQAWKSGSNGFTSQRIIQMIQLWYVYVKTCIHVIFWDKGALKFNMVPCLSWLRNFEGVFTNALFFSGHCS